MIFLLKIGKISIICFDIFFTFTIDRKAKMLYDYISKDFI